jgi:hypothetical protein
MAIEDSGHVIDRRADVAEDDCPGEKPVELPGIFIRLHYRVKTICLQVVSLAMTSTPKSNSLSLSGVL